MIKRIKDVIAYYIKFLLCYKCKDCKYYAPAWTPKENDDSGECYILPLKLREWGLFDISSSKFTKPIIVKPNKRVCRRFELRYIVSNN